MKCTFQKIFFTVILIKMVNASYVLPNEKLLRVRRPEEANGKPYFLDFIGLAEKYGYHAEQHFVTTQDGYILEIFRIPGSSTPRPVVLVQHGLYATSDSWALFKRSIVYFLADEGYDVWVGNFRGNSYGRSHKTLSPEEPRFWNFSWHEMGKMDYPAMIDYILYVTNKPNLTLIGHSMGATTMMVLMSEKPEYNKKINIAVPMAPVVYWKQYDLQRVMVWKGIYGFKDIFDPTGMTELLPQSTLSSRLLNDFCQRFGIYELCLKLLGIVMGYDPVQISKDTLLNAINYYPTGASTKCVWHYCQSALSIGKFRKYDYESKNLYYYGQIEPPDYNLSNFVTNMAIIYSGNDPYCLDEDVVELVKHVPTNPIVEKVKFRGFSHLDFVLATDLKTLLHDTILQIISKYKN